MVCLDPPLHPLSQASCRAALDGVNFLATQRPALSCACTMVLSCAPSSASLTALTDEKHMLLNRQDGQVAQLLIGKEAEPSTEAESRWIRGRLSRNKPKRG